MSDWTTLLTDLQDEVFYRLKSAEYFSDVAVILERKGNIEQDVLTALSVLNEQSGKYGACVIVLMPEMRDPEENLPGPPVSVLLSVLVKENRMVNEDTDNGGTGKSAEAIGRVALNLLHQYIPFGLDTSSALRADKKPITPVRTDDGTVTYLVNLIVNTFIQGPSKVATPSHTFGGGLSTLTCATSGASIYYTLDGSYPGSGNPEAELYSAPFDPGTSNIRAVAYKSGMSPSDCMFTA